VFTFFCTAALSPAQSARRLPVIDGKLDDPIWQEIAPEELVSDPSAPTGIGGQIRAVVLGRYLFVAARLPEPSGRFTARVTGRNPSWEEEDLLRVAAASDIGSADRILSINPLGAYYHSPERGQVSGR
jgi:hypothetical protein